MHSGEGVELGAEEVGRGWEEAGKRQAGKRQGGGRARVGRSRVGVKPWGKGWNGLAGAGGSSQTQRICPGPCTPLGMVLPMSDISLETFWEKTT